MSTPPMRGLVALPPPEASVLLPIDRPLVDRWDDRRVTDRVLATGRRNLIISGLRTETSVCAPALRAVAEMLDVHVVTDACGGVPFESHDRAVTRSGEGSSPTLARSRPLVTAPASGW
ncbi:isochorismatase family protein [Streptomyces sp. NPDC090499]|uniref:isochorismatase family protein n=1 Tax=Streptomyces sp. NPDC090499 TaxID=3365965 RepID=UPI00381D3A80